MNAIRATYIAGDQFLLDLGDHALLVDQPASAGGWDSGPTPTELFIGGLVACVAHYAHGYLARHDLDATDLAVSADWELAADRPARVGKVTIRIEVPATVPESRRAALLAVASHCTVHNSLEDPPQVSIDLAPQATHVAA